jgi:prepilin-type N-terminal cleavage/methylation domain-containing protein
MNTRSRQSARPMRPGLTLPELLVGIAAVGVLGSLLLVRTCPAPPTSLSITPAYPSPAAAEAVSDNLLVNGSFEACPFAFGRRSLPGWRITRGTVDILTPGYWEPAPGQGKCSLDLVGTPGAATIEQTFTTEPGREYRFSGWFAHNPEGGHTDARAEAFVNGKLLLQLYHRDAAAHNRAMHWLPFACRFRAAGPRATLAISDASSHGELCGTALDGLMVTRAPD